MEFLFAVAVLTVAYFLVKKIRGPLPPPPPKPPTGGQTEEDPDEPRGPVNEE